MGDQAVSIRGLEVVRGSVRALQGVDLDIPAGAITGLLGPSGSGKTTLMRVIVGSQVITSGTAEVFGLPAGSAALRPRIGYMSQLPALYADLTVTENLRYFAALLDQGPDRVGEVVEQVEIGHRAGAMVRELSGGEASRVSLAAALLGRPDLLVLDEPTVGLDPVLRQSLWQLFRSLADAGTTLLVSSHVMDEARRCDRLALLREGQALFVGTQAELLARMAVPDVEMAFIALALGRPS